MYVSRCSRYQQLHQSCPECPCTRISPCYHITPVCAILTSGSRGRRSLVAGDARTNIFDDAGRHAPAGPDLDTDNAWPHECPVPSEAAVEILRQLAGRYMPVDQPDSRVDMVRVELSPNDGFMVTIVLEIQVAGLL